MGNDYSIHLSAENVLFFGNFSDLLIYSTELTEELLNTLVEKIVLHEKEDVDGECLMRVEIYYRFIGSVGGSSGDDLMAKNTIGGANRR